MDPFQRLPAELVGQILQDTADFAGVDSLISVSLHARATFQANSCTISQGLIYSNSITSQGCAVSPSPKKSKVEDTISSYLSSKANDTRGVY